MKPTQTKASISLGTLAALAAASTSQAATVQITLTGNRISTAGNTLNADITGDAINDLLFKNPVMSPSRVDVEVAYAGVNYRVIRASTFSNFYAKASFRPGGVGIRTNIGATVQNINYLNPITITDSRINGGAATQAWLQVNAFNTSTTFQTVALTRAIFDDASTTRPAFSSVPGAQTEWAAVPEPSSLALLALGAGGLLRRRRQQA